MRVLRGDHRTWVPPESGAAIAIGVFDGVHRGHQAVLSGLRRKAAELGELPLTVLTFDRHPLAIVAPERVPPLLTSEAQKLEILAGIGVDAVAILTFDEATRSLSPEDFAADVIAGALGGSVVAVGSDFRFGKARAGDIETLRTLGLGLGFYVQEVELLRNDGLISATAIREAIAVGDMIEAARFLGRPFELRGTVIAGDARGKEIGFPTANLDVDPALAVPARGVYAAWAGIDSFTHPAVVNIGVRPTFGGTREVVEAHLIDYDADLYGRELRLEFAARLRPERRFDDVGELVAQISRDVAAGRDALGVG